MPRSPVLPAPYELIKIDNNRNAVRAAISLVAKGANEGSLVWAPQRAVHQKTHSAPHADLSCALILRPDYSAPISNQIAFVATVSVGAALADITPALTSLRYRWPNEVIVNDARVAEIQLYRPSHESVEWLILELKVNIAPVHGPRSRDETSLTTEDINEISDIHMLELFARHFLSWINRWADQGFSSVQRTWLSRADGIGDALEIKVYPHTIHGTLETVDEQGNVILRLSEGNTRRISLSDCLVKYPDLDNLS